MQHDLTIHQGMLNVIGGSAILRDLFESVFSPDKAALLVAGNRPQDIRFINILRLSHVHVPSAIPDDMVYRLFIDIMSIRVDARVDPSHDCDDGVDSLQEPASALVTTLGSAPRFTCFKGIIAQYSSHRHYPSRLVREGRSHEAFFEWDKMRRLRAGGSRGLTHSGGRG
jgi:hypothetical protein